MDGHDFTYGQSGLEAAYLLAQANLTHQEIADHVGVARQTLWNWRQHPEFIAKYEQYKVEIQEDVRRIGVADMLRRVAAQNDRWNRMRRVIEARADDQSMQEVPGGNTGLLVRTTKSLGSGPSATTVDEYAVDTGLLKALLDHEKQAAQELGQWADRVESKVDLKADMIRLVEVPGGFSVPTPHDAKPSE